MAQMLNPAGFGGRNGSLLHARSEQPSRFLKSIGRADEPEPPMVVTFVGISEAQQRAAIGAFPGGSRFVLAAPQPEGLLRQS